MSGPTKKSSPATDSMTRRELLALGLVGLVASPLASDIYVQQVEPFWVEYHDVPLRVRNLPGAFEGFRVTHLTDLHITNKPDTLLQMQRVVQTINQAAPDLVVITGDLITAGHSNPEMVVQAVSQLQPPTLVTLGNHDYGSYITEQGRHRTNAHRQLIAMLNKLDKRVLTNQSHAVERDGQRLWFVGLEDYAVGNFDFAKGMANVPQGETTFVLSHNPDSAEILDDPRVSMILAGHTHGGQVRLPLIGPLYVPVKNRQWDQGFFELKNSSLYVSRGVGYLFRIRVFCRPEVPTYVLTCA